MTRYRNDRDTMTKDEFLARCATAWDCGYVTPDRLCLMMRWLDFVMRFEGGQLSMALDFLVDERRRNKCPAGTSSGAIGNLAGDADGYALIQLSCLLAHPCQKCATDTSAWHTRAGFCEHREGRALTDGVGPDDSEKGVG